MATHTSPTNATRDAGQWKQEEGTHGKNYRITEGGKTVATIPWTRGDVGPLIAAAPALLAALDQLQSTPNDPRAHRQAFDAMTLARGEAAQ